MTSCSGLRNIRFEVDTLDASGVPRRKLGTVHRYVVLSWTTTAAQSDALMRHLRTDVLDLAGVSLRLRVARSSLSLHGLRVIIACIPRVVLTLLLAPLR